MAERDVAEANVEQALQNLHRRRDACLTVGEEGMGLVDGHLVDIRDALATKRVLEDFGLESPAFTFDAWRRDRRHRTEVREDHPVALADRAGAFRVRGEERGLHAVDLRECLPHGIEQRRVRRRIRSSGSLDGGLIDEDRVDVLRE